MQPSSESVMETPTSVGGKAEALAKFRPTNNHVLIRRNKADEKTASGLLFIPDTAKKVPHRGEVLAVGPGSKLDNGRLSPMEVSPGDQVLYDEWQGIEIGLEVTLGGEKLHVVRMEHVLAVLEP